VTTSDEAEDAVDLAQPPPDADRSDDVVLLVHGTFAADKDREDVGERWWQRGSAPWRWLTSNLPPGTALPDDGLLFHWSGANSQAERLAASTSLLATMIELEMEGRNYHLVGHSHGGSVIWEALVSAQAMQSSSSFYGALRDHLTARGKLPPPRRSSKGGGGRRSRAASMAQAWRQQTREYNGYTRLEGLRSWTTVGTPFLHHLPRRGRLLDGWPSQSFPLASRARSGGHSAVDRAHAGQLRVHLGRSSLHAFSLRRLSAQQPAGGLGVAGDPPSGPAVGSGRHEHAKPCGLW
jgi:hypothetical protein